MRVTIFGSGYVGLVTGACLADAGNHVVCVDVDAGKIERLNRGEIPIHEPGLDVLVKRNAEAGRLEFTTDAARGVEHGLFQLIAVGTPPDEDGSADLRYVLSVARTIGTHMTRYCVVVTKSTVPVGTADKVRAELQKTLAGRASSVEFDVVSNPEFLREGTAIIDFLHPDRIVVGANNPRAAEVLERIYAPLTNGSYFATKGALPGMLSAENPAKLLVTSAQSAEIIKHASNAFLALKISFINAVANLAESVDADIEDIAAGMGLDSRIGPKFLRAGLGYGGSCFPKDVAAFYWVAQQQGVDFQLLEEVRKINATQQDVFFNKVRSALWTLRGKKLAALGLAFKGDTDDIRDSPAIDVIKKLIAAGCSITAYDPAAMERTESVLPASENMKYASSAYEAAEGADAVLILTDWAEFSKLDLQKLNQALRFPIVIDGRNLYKPSEMQEQGFTYVSVGRPAAYTAQQGKPRKLVLS